MHFHDSLGAHRKTRNLSARLMALRLRTADAEEMELGTVRTFHMVNTCSLFEEEIKMVMLVNQYNTLGMWVSLGSS